MNILLSLTWKKKSNSLNRRSNIMRLYDAFMGPRKSLRQGKNERTQHKEQEKTVWENSQCYSKSLLSSFRLIGYLWMLETQIIWPSWLNYGRQRGKALFCSFHLNGHIFEFTHLI